MGFTSTTVKYILFFFNFVIAIGGAAVFGVAIYIWKGGQNNYTDITKEDITTPCIILAIAGAFVFILAFLGCCGAIQESHCMLILYAIILLLVIVVEAAVVGFAYYKKTNIEQAYTTAMVNAFQTYDSDPTNTKSIDSLQQAFHCCGTNGPAFYLTIGKEIPPSCFSDNKVLQTDGCITKFTDFIKSNLQTVMHVAIGVGVAEIIAVVFGLYYASHIRRYSQQGYA